MQVDVLYHSANQAAWCAEQIGRKSNTKKYLTTVYGHSLNAYNGDTNNKLPDLRGSAVLKYKCISFNGLGKLLSFQSIDQTY